MKVHAPFIAALVLTLSLAGVLSAQRVGVGIGVGRGGRPSVGLSVNPFAPYNPYVGVSPYGYGMTAAGAQAQGAAEMIRASGEASRDRAEAIKSYEEARSQYIDNKKKWTETYLEHKEKGRQSREEYYARKRADRERAQEFLAARDEPRISRTELDPVTGALDWPAALTDARFAEDRDRLDELFSVRAHTGANQDMISEVTTTASTMQNQLKSLIRDMPANEYIAARKFLDLLQSEVTYPTR